MDIQQTLYLIKDYTGLNLKLDPHFTEIKNLNGKIYFNVELEKPLFCSLEYKILQIFANKYKIISVESNGYKRVAIFTN